jgi:hypothetical protein
MTTDYEICQVPTYKVKYEKSKKMIKPIESINDILLNDLQLHERLNKNDLLKLSVDIDKLTENNETATREKVFEDICEYVGINMNDISYTTNFSVESGSHHVIIPKYFMKSADQKKYWYNFRTKYGYGKEIDVGVLGKNTWFRLPNQTKEGKEGTEHIIQQGEIHDFVLKYIEKSEEYICELKTETKPEKVKKEKVKPEKVKPEKVKKELIIVDDEETESSVDDDDSEDETLEKTLEIQEDIKKLLDMIILDEKQKKDRTVSEMMRGNKVVGLDWYLDFEPKKLEKGCGNRNKRSWKTHRCMI